MSPLSGASNESAWNLSENTFMNQLLKLTGDGWSLTSEEATDWSEEEASVPGKRLLLKPDDTPQQDLAFVELIGIDFPAFSDGRGLSLAYLIRRLNFKGDLRAVGDVSAELIAPLLRSGFTSIELTQQVDKALIQKRLGAHANYYQSSATSLKDLSEEPT